MIRGKIINFLIDFFLMLLISFSFAFMGLTDLGFSPQALVIIQALVTILLIYSIIFINKKSFLISLIISLTSLAAWIIYIIATNQAEKMLIKFYKLLIWLYEYNYNSISVNWTYAKILSILVCMGICLGVYLFTKKKWHFLLITLIGSGYFLYLWYKDYLVIRWTIYLFLFSCLLYFFRYRYYRYGKPIESEHSVDYLWFMLWGAIISSVVFIFSYNYSKSHVIRLQWVRNTVNKFTAKSNYYYESDEFSVISACFGEDSSRLGGNLTPNDILVLKVHSPKKVYLKAITKDTYTGDSWINSDIYEHYSDDELAWINYVFNNHKIDSIYLDSFESMVGIKELIGEDADFNIYFYDYELDIEFQNIITKSIFVPQNFYQLNLDNDRDSYGVQDNRSGLFFDEAKGKGYSYSAKFYLPKRNQEEFIELVRKSKKNIYKDNYDNVIKGSKERDESRKELLDNLIKHSERINEQYLSLPDTLPERVKELAYEITKDQETDYDKVKAIEKYFMTDFHYTYNPGDVPEGRDFVDYFLFDSKQGYCTYYATAMTILVRSLGIPARYVEGYCLTSDTWEGKNEYMVTNEQAHAWTEVYFEGIGWLNFEPTPPYHREYEEGQGDFQNMMPFYQDYYQNLVDTTENMDIDNDEMIAYGGRISFKPSILFATILIILLMIILINFIKVRLKIRKMIHGDGKESAILIYEEYLKIAKYLGYPIKDFETPLLYSQRVNKVFNDKEITYLFLKARYSPNHLSKEEIKIMYSFYTNLIKKTKASIGKFNFYVSRLLFGKI